MGFLFGMFIAKINRISHVRIQQYIWIIKQNKAVLLKAIVNKYPLVSPLFLVCYF